MREERYTGWSTAYSVTSILIQLQSTALSVIFGFQSTVC